MGSVGLLFSPCRPRSRVRGGVSSCLVRDLRISGLSAAQPTGLWGEMWGRRGPGPTGRPQAGSEVALPRPLLSFLHLLDPESAGRGTVVRGSHHQGREC